MSKKIIFGTGTPRSGGTLLSNILSVHKDISITTDLVHFFRHIYKKYCPISKSSNQSKLVYELCTRIKYRQQIILSPEEMLSHFDKVENYSDVIAAISDFFLRPKEVILIPFFFALLDKIDLYDICSLLER